jgi:hypothetical protein
VEELTNMNKTFRSAKLIAGILAVMAVSALPARAAATVYAEEVSSNAVPAQQGPSTSFVDRAGKYAADIEVKRIETERKMAADRLDARDHLFGILTGFGIPVAIVAIVMCFKHRRNKLAHETLRAMIEKGMPITPELVAELRYRCGYGPMQNLTRGGSLFPGLVLAGIGTALLVSGSGQSKGGWVVLFIGVAFLIVWLVERQNQGNVPPPKL